MVGSKVWFLVIGASDSDTIEGAGVSRDESQRYGRFKFEKDGGLYMHFGVCIMRELVTRPRNRAPDKQQEPVVVLDRLANRIISSNVYG